MKALGYISSSVGNDILQDDDVTVNEPKILALNEKVNKLHVTIHNCSGLTSMSMFSFYFQPVYINLKTLCNHINEVKFKNFKKYLKV